MANYYSKPLLTQYEILHIDHWENALTKYKASASCSKVEASSEFVRKLHVDSGKLCKFAASSEFVCKLAFGKLFVGKLPEAYK